MGLASKIKQSEAASQPAQPKAQPTPSAPPLHADPSQYGKQQQQQQQPYYGAGASPYPAPGYPQPPPQDPYRQSHSYAFPPPYGQPPPPYAAQPHADRAESTTPLAYPFPPHGAPSGYPQPGAAYAQPQPYGAAYTQHEAHGAVRHDSQPGYMAGPPHQQTPAAHRHSMPPSSNNMDMLAKKLQLIIQTHGLQRFYDSGRFQTVLQKLSCIDFTDIAAQWRIGKELAYDLAPLVLYDIVFYCDDSGSMAFEENGERINDLKFILSRVSGIATLFDDDGIIVRFMNSNVNGDGIRSAGDVTNLLSQVRFSGATPLGTNFDRKVIQPLVLGQALGNASMSKPVLAILITDGEPYGESRDTIVQVIRHAKDSLSRTPYGSGALAVQIAQVGKDAKTQKFLEALDKDPFVGGMIDCTSYYEMEEEEFARKGVTLTPELWLLKMCVGAIDPDYDSKDD